MKAIALLAIAAWSTSSLAAATVTFTQPDKYADMPFTQDGKEQVFKDLRQYFDKLATQLPQGQDLKVEIVDIDLAGRLKPNSRASADFRIMDGGADWPMIKLRYSVEAQGQSVKSGESRLSDMTYLNRFNGHSSGDPLRYEKQMIDEWFKKTILGKS